MTTPGSPPELSRRTQALTRNLALLATGLALTVAGSVAARLIDPPYGDSGASTALLLYAGFLLTAGAAVFWRHKLLTTHPVSAGPAAPGPTPPDRPDLPAATPEGPSPTEELTPTEAAHPGVVRLAEVLPPSILISRGSVHFNDESICDGFNLRSRNKGAFTDPKIQDNLFIKITGSIGGKWIMKAQPERDELEFARKVNFPRLISTPIPPRIADSIETAVAMHKDTTIYLGQKANGQQLAIRLSDYPHWLIAGVTGTGKSVFNRGVIIEQFRSLGFMLFLCDGKGTDYDGMHGVPNIVAISQSTPDHLRIIRMFADELRSRRADAKKALRERAAGTSSGSAFRRPPAALLVDEWATVLRDVNTMYGKEGVDQLLDDLLFITQVGREFRMHLLLSTQAAYRKTINGDLATNLTMMISLGEPESRTIQEVIATPLRPEARRIGSTITRDDKGRALVALANADTGDNEVVEFQSYYGYSPGEPKPDEIPGPLRDPHREFKEMVSDRILKLYPRVWFQVPDPKYSIDLEVLYELEPIILDHSDGTPNPEVFIFDPTHPTYQGVNTKGAPPIPALAELTADHAYAQASGLGFHAGTSGDDVETGGAGDDSFYYGDELDDDCPIDQDAVDANPRARSINKPRGGGVFPLR